MKLDLAEYSNGYQEIYRDIGALFSQARKADIDLDSLGQALDRRKQELLATFKAEGVPGPELTTMTEASA